MDICNVREVTEALPTFKSPGYSLCEQPYVIAQRELSRRESMSCSVEGGTIENVSIL